MTETTDLDIAMMTLQSLVTDWLRTRIEWLMMKGLSEFDALNLILDMGEILLDEISTP